MTTTVQQILLGAFARDSTADVTTLSTQQAESIAQIGRIVRKFLTVGRRENPYYFGTIRNVPLSTSGGIAGWRRPADAETVFRLEAAADTVNQVPAAITLGTEIKVAPFDDRGLLAGEPSVYEFAQTFIRCGNAGDPNAGSLNVFYVAASSMPVALGDIIDARFPDAHADLLICETNLWLRSREDRAPGAFLAARDEAAELYLQAIRDATINVTRRFESAREYTVSPARKEA